MFVFTSKTPMLFHKGPEDHRGQFCKKFEICRNLNLAPKRTKFGQNEKKTVINLKDPLRDGKHLSFLEHNL